MTNQPAQQQKPLYQGSGQLGAELRRMSTVGRTVVQQERSRLLVNRAFYMGNQYLQPIGGGGVRQMAPTSRLKSGRVRAQINRLRQFTDGRVAMLTREIPPFEVVSRNMEHDEHTSARTQEKLVEYEWTNTDGWNVQGFRRHLAIAAEQDGVAFATVRYDPHTGPKTREPVAVAPNPEGQWAPVTNREQLEALQAQDPEGESLWRQVNVPTGDVVFRVVRLGKLSIDPQVTTDWRRCRWVIESDVWPVEKLERIAGRRLQEMRTESAAMLRSPSQQTPGSIYVEDGYQDRQVTGGNNVLVHEAFIEAQGPGSDWPEGGHILWADVAPASPFIQEPWPDGIPYYPYVPRPDGLHILRSRGTVDELRPVQVSFNRTVSAIEEWLSKLARPPLILNGGSIQSNTPVFNEEGVLIVNPGFSPPQFMPVPSEPTAVLTQWAGFLLNQMAEIAVQSDVTRGTPPGQGIDAGVALNVLDQNNETQLSGAESELRKTTEWAVNEALRLVRKHFKVERVVTLPGVNGEDELVSFQGSQLREARFRVTGSTLPRSREQQRQALIEAVGLTGGKLDITRYVTDLVDGDIDEVTRRLRAQGQRQANENRMILALGRHPLRDEIWGAFVQQRDMYIALLQAAQADPNVADPQSFMRQQGLTPPRLSDMLARVAAMQGEAGMRVPGLPAANPEAWPDPPRLPVVEEFDFHPDHIQGVDDACLSDGYPEYHDIVKQAFREHRDDHLKALARQNPPAPPMGAEMAPQPGQVAA